MEVQVQPETCITLMICCLVGFGFWLVWGVCLFCLFVGWFSVGFGFSVCFLFVGLVVCVF